MFLEVREETASRLQQVYQRCGFSGLRRPPEPELALALDRVAAIPDARDETAVCRVEVHAAARAGDDQRPVPLVDQDVPGDDRPRVVHRLAGRALAGPMPALRMPRAAPPRAALVLEAAAEPAEDPVEPRGDLLDARAPRALERAESGLRPSHRPLPRDQILPLPQEVERLAERRPPEDVDAVAHRPAPRARRADLEGHGEHPAALAVAGEEREEPGGDLATETERRLRAERLEQRAVDLRLVADEGDERRGIGVEAVHLRVPQVEAELREVFPARHTGRRVPDEDMTVGRGRGVLARRAPAAVAERVPRPERGRMLDGVLERPVDLPDQMGGEDARPRPLAPQDERELQQDRSERALDEVLAGLAREPLPHEALENVEGDLPQGRAALLHCNLLEHRRRGREVLAVAPQPRD